MQHYFTNNENLTSQIRYIKYKYKDYELEFASDNGVFSKDKVDYGSKLLVETYLDNKTNVNSILDVGCGYGFIGITLAKILNVNTTLIDINKRAVHLTKRNIKQNDVNANVKYSNVYENVSDKYDLIITNPPIRAGKNIVLSILNDASNYLNDCGQIWFVARANQGVKSINNALEDKYNINIITKSKGFYVVKLTLKD